MGTILHQFSPGHTHIHHFLNIHFNIILPPTPTSPKYEEVMGGAFGNSLVKEIQVVPERDGKANSWIRVDRTDFIRLTYKWFKKKTKKKLITNNITAIYTIR
jgi:hypothetical protein